MTRDAPAAEAIASATRLLHRVAAAGIGLTLAVIVASAYLRLALAGLGCADWPACYGPGDATRAGAASLAFTIMRVTHRLAASGVGFLVIAIAAVGFGRLRHQLGCMGLAGLIVALTLFLAVLGTATPGAQLPAVTLGNLLGGMALLAAMAWLHLATREAPPRARLAATPLTMIGIALFAAQLVLGALVSARYAGASCPAFPACGANWEVSGATAALLDPWRMGGSFRGSALIDDPARAGLHVLHRIAAGVVVIVWCGIALAALRGRTRATLSATCAAVAMLAQCALGAAAVLFGLPLALAVAHNACAALAVLAVTAAAYQSSVSDEAKVSAACQMVISK